MKNACLGDRHGSRTHEGRPSCFVIPRETSSDRPADPPTCGSVDRTAARVVGDVDALQITLVAEWTRQPQLLLVRNSSCTSCRSGRSSAGWLESLRREAGILD